MFEAGRDLPNDFGTLDEMWEEDGVLMVDTEKGLTIARTLIPVRERRIEFAKMQRWLHHPMIQAAARVAHSGADFRKRCKQIGCPPSVINRLI